MSPKQILDTHAEAVSCLDCFAPLRRDAYIAGRCDACIAENAKVEWEVSSIRLVKRAFRETAESLPYVMEQL